MPCCIIFTAKEHPVEQHIPSGQKEELDLVYKILRRTGSQVCTCHTLQIGCWVFVKKLFLLFVCWPLFEMSLGVGGQKLHLLDVLCYQRCRGFERKVKFRVLDSALIRQWKQ